jgi:hypothetical protein
MSTIQRIPTAVALPLTVNNNEYYFDVSASNGQIDHKSSYQELEMVLYDASGAKVTDYRNVVFGQDGLLYNSSALFRTSSLMESRSKKVYQNLSFVNILSNNLEYWTKGVNDVKSDALYSGQGVVSSDGNVLSVFNNNYQDPNPVVKVPLSVIYPGDLGVSEVFGQQEDLEYRYLLESQYPAFMRAVDANAYSQSSLGALGEDKSFANALAGATTLTASALGIVIVGAYAVGDIVSITYTDPSGVITTQVRTLTAVTVDADPTIGSIAFANELNAGAITAVTVQKYTVNAGSIKCGVTNTTTLTLNPAGTTPGWPVKKDIYKNTVIQISYVDASGNQQLMNNKVSALTLDGTSANILSITLNTALPSVNIQNVSLVPLYTNLDDFTWQVLSANLVLYRRMTPLAMPESILYSTFESKNVQCVGGLNKFSYTFKTPSNGYNTFLMMPNNTNLYSQLPEYGSYKYTVNNKDLTQIYIPLKDNVLHKDNMIRALSNSLVYIPKNLSKFRDTDIIQSFDPEIVPAKIFHSQIRGQELNVQNEMAPDNDTLVEVFASQGQSTSAKNVYLFVEKFVKV